MNNNISNDAPLEDKCGDSINSEQFKEIKIRPLNQVYFNWEVYTDYLYRELIVQMFLNEIQVFYYRLFHRDRH